jgi:hypothetical protein
MLCGRGVARARCRATCHRGRSATGACNFIVNNSTVTNGESLGLLNTVGVLTRNAFGSLSPRYKSQSRGVGVDRCARDGKSPLPGIIATV